jgi:hypothetical protein
MGRDHYEGSGVRSEEEIVMFIAEDFYKNGNETLTKGDECVD